MILKKINLFNGADKLKVIIYSFCSNIINTIAPDLKHRYDIISTIYNRNGAIERVNENYEVTFPIVKINNFILKEDSSDLEVFKQIIIDKEYEYVLQLINVHNIEINTILDAGANIGLTSIYLKNFFPEARIVALEPNFTTYQRLVTNINYSGLTNIELLNIGLWNKSTFLKADNTFRDGKDWSFRLVETSDRSEMLFESNSVDDLIAKFAFDSIDFFKIDIEGGEDIVFSDIESTVWLKKVKLIAIEIHDEFDCRSRIEQILQYYNFQIFESGELTVGINKVD